MAKEKRTITLAPETLYRDIRAVLESARSSAYRAVNTAMVLAYWQVGRLIVEHEQGGRKRAAYGEAVLDELSQRLSADFGRGLTCATCDTCVSSISRFRWTAPCRPAAVPT